MCIYEDQIHDFEQLILPEKDNVVFSGVLLRSICINFEEIKWFVEELKFMSAIDKASSSWIVMEFLKVWSEKVEEELILFLGQVCLEKINIIEKFFSIVIEITQVTEIFLRYTQVTDFSVKV